LTFSTIFVLLQEFSEISVGEKSSKTLLAVASNALIVIKPALTDN
jgi:hypothetical protein